VVLCLQANLFFVMEFAHAGNLSDQLDQVQQFSEPAATLYVTETALAVQFLHEKGIVHR
jgi:serine/threonine protein kinase